jgi:hypothetical protein
VGMKLEAVDKKNPHLICCATIGAVNGTTRETRVLRIHDILGRIRIRITRIHASD